MLPIPLFLQTPSASPAAGSQILGFLPMIAIFGIFYILLILPMQRQRKAQQRMLKELQPGQTVLTSGGVIGTITDMKEDDTLVLRVKPDGIKLQIARSAISAVIPPAGEVKTK